MPIALSPRCYRCRMLKEQANQAITRDQVRTLVSCHASCTGSCYSPRRTSASPTLLFLTPPQEAAFSSFSLSTARPGQTHRILCFCSSSPSRASCWQPTKRPGSTSAMVSAGGASVWRVQHTTGPSPLPPRWRCVPCRLQEVGASKGVPTAEAGADTDPAQPTGRRLQPSAPPLCSSPSLAAARSAAYPPATTLTSAPVRRMPATAARMAGPAPAPSASYRAMAQRPLKAAPLSPHSSAHPVPGSTALTRGRMPAVSRRRLRGSVNRQAAPRT